MLTRGYENFDDGNIGFTYRTNCSWATYTEKILLASINKIVNPQNLYTEKIITELLA